MAVTALNVRPLKGSVTRDFVAGGALVTGNAFYIVSDGDVEATDANVVASAQGRGIVVSVADTSGGVTAAVAGDAVTGVTHGPVGGFTGLTPGATLFVSETTGEITHTAPTGAGTFTHPIGYAESATVAYIDPSVSVPVENS